MTAAKTHKPNQSWFASRIPFISTLIIASLLLARPGFVQADNGISMPAEMNKEFDPSSIPAGDVSTLTVNIYNPNAFPLTLSYIPAAWTDTLPDGITFANPAEPTTTCGGTVSMVGQTLSLIGGTVPAQAGTVPGTCRVTVKVTSVVPGNHDNVILANNLKATDPTGTIQVTNTSPATRTLQVLSVQPPSLSKGFIPNTQWVGVPSQMRINIKNNDLNNSLTEVSVSDLLPENLVIANSSTGFSNCGPGVTVTGPGGLPLAAEQTQITILNATIAPNTTCTTTVNVVSIDPDVYINNIPSNAIQSRQGGTNSTAASAPINYQAIGMTKSFLPATIEANSTSTMSIFLQNPSAAAYTGVTFTDTLPSGLTIAEEPNISQCEGDVTYTVDSITLTGGTVPAASGSPGLCTITAKVTSALSGSFTNTILAGKLETDQNATNVDDVTANITVYGTGTGMTGSKSFSPSTIAVGGVSRMTINLSAPADTALTNFSVTDALPTNLRVAETPNPTKSAYCVGGTFSPAAGSTTVSYTGGQIPAGRQCSLAVNVTSNVKGSYANIISPINISNNENRNISSNISRTLNVSGISVSKSFYSSSVNINGISTLTVVLTNTNPSQLDDVQFVDNLPTDVRIAPDPRKSTTCGGADLVTAIPDATSFSLAGGTIPAQVGGVPGICTVNVNVIGKATGIKPNRIEANAVSGVIRDSGVRITNPDRAPADLTVANLTITVNKDINPVEVFGGSASIMKIRLTNPNNAPLTGIGFIDVLPVSEDPLNPGQMTVAIPAQISTGTCGGSITIAPDRSSFEFEGGSLAANTFCELKINITMNVSGNLTNTIQAGDVTSVNGASNLQSASSSLTNLAGASLTKYFLTNPVPAGSGNATTLNIIIQNIGNASLTQLGFTDTFPAGLSVSEPPILDQCGGLVTAVGDSVTLTGGSLTAHENCTISVNLVAAAAGSYENCIPAETLTSYQGATNVDPTCDTLVVEQPLLPPVISKAFSPNPVRTGATSGLTFTITNPNNVALTGIAFSDTFPLDLERASVPNAAQCGGLVTSTANSVSLSGGSIPANSFCTVAIGVRSTTGGVYPNLSNEVTSTNGGTGNTASASLTVIAPPVIGKTFSPNPVIPGEASTLTFTITNPEENTVALTGIAFTDTFPVGLMRSTAPETFQCNGTVTSTAGSISLSGGSLPVGGSCIVTIPVSAVNGGNYPNTSSAVTSTNGGSGNTASDTLVVNGVGLALEKTSSRTNFRSAGDVVTYSYRLTNTGNDTLFAPFTIQDDKVAGPFDCGGQTQIPVGGFIVCTSTYEITTDDMTTRLITNTATAIAKDAIGGNVLSNESSATVYLAALTLNKSASPQTYLAAGNTITYTYTLTNTGAIRLYAPFEITDTRFTTKQTCSSVPSLQPGGVTTCTRNYTITAPDVAAGSVTNLATATAMDAETGGTPVLSNEASRTVVKVVPPSLVKVFSPNPVAVGGVSTLTFTITHTNPISLTDVELVDNLPAGLIPVFPPSASQCGGSVVYDSGLNQITLDNGSIIPNSSCTVKVQVSALSPGAYNNTSNAVRAANAGTGNTAQATLNVVTAPLISKSFSPTAITQGETSIMTITITNPPGNTQPLTGVAFTDYLPIGMQVSADGAVTVTNCGTPVFPLSEGETSLVFSGGSIAVGGTCVVTVPITTTKAGPFENTTEPVTSANGGSGVRSNTATLSVSEAIDLSITKDDGEQAVNRDQELIYRIVVSNAGPSDAVAARVVDTFSATLTEVSWTCTPEDGATCSASGTGNINDIVNLPAGKQLTYTVNAKVIPAVSTSIVNTAIVIPPAGIEDENLENNTTTDTDLLNLMEIGKSSETTYYDSLNQEILYTYIVTNTGTSTLVAPFAVEDDKAVITCSYPASLEPGVQFTCTGSYRITLEDLDNGMLVNQAYATSTDPEGDPVTSNTAELTIEGIQLPMIGAAKRVVHMEETSPGSYDITYEMIIKNYGNVTVREVQMTDDLKAAFSSPLPASFSVKSIESDDFSINPLFDGNTVITMLGEGNTLAAYASGKITLVVTVVPTSGGPYNNSAFAYATHPVEEIIQDQSHNGTEPVPGGDGTPDAYNDPTPVEFGADLFDPPLGIKTVDATGRPLLEWTMVWINNSNLADVAGFVSDPIPVNTEYFPTAVDSGFPAPNDGIPGTTSLGVTCIATGASVTRLCYFQGPTLPDYPRGRIIWEGTIGPDFGVTNPALAQNTMTISFNVLLQNGATRATNRATIDSDRNGDGDALDANELQVAAASKTWRPPAKKQSLPATGFTPNIMTSLPDQPSGLVYYDLDSLRLEIPAFDVNLPIVGVPETSDGWDLTWLGQQAGWLNGTAFPTWKGNSAITAHVYDANGNPGPFANLHQLKWGDRVIVHAYGQKYIYEVREVDRWISPDDADALPPEDYPWLTLITCKGYDEEKDFYRWRVVVRAVQVKVE